MDIGKITYLQNISDIVIDEAAYWCVLNGKNIDYLDEENFAQCITDVASALDLTEEDVEIILKEYLE